MPDFFFQPSEKTYQLITSINSPLKEKYIEDRLLANQEDWVSTYNVIKDESWPDCCSYSEFYNLPKHVQEECTKQHSFSPDLLKNSIEADANKLYNVDRTTQTSTLRFGVSNFLEKHLDVIRDQRIVDFACRIGLWSLYCIHNQCLSVVGTDIRTDNISIANSFKEDLKITDDKAKFIISDIHDYDQNTAMCKDKDTALLLGLMYHVHDHVNILDSIFRSDVKNIIIDSGIVESEHPIIKWKTESTFEPISGWHNSRDTVPVGYPSISFFDLIMSTNGFVKVDQACYDLYTSSTEKTEKFRTPRAVILYRKQ